MQILNENDLSTEKTRMLEFTEKVTKKKDRNRSMNFGGEMNSLKKAAKDIKKRSIRW